MAEDSEAQGTSTSLTTGSEVTFDIVCTPCDNDGEVNEADRYCLDCKEYLCATCLKYHNKLASSKHHTLLDKDNVKGTQGALPVNDVCTQRCQTHMDEVIKYYCPTHKALGCGDCMIRSHDACKGKLCIPDEAKKLTDSKEFTDFQALLKKLTKCSNTIIKSSHVNIKSSAKNRVKALQDIETFRQEINVALDKLRVALEEQIEEMATREEAAIDSVTNKTNTVQAELQQMSSDINNLLSKGQHCQVFIEMKTKENRLVDLQSQLEKIEASGVTAFRFKPNEDLQNMVRGKDALGELLVMNPMEPKAAHIADINVKTSWNEETCRISGTTLLMMDKLVVADWNNKTVKLVDTKLKQVISEYKPEKPAMDVTSISNNKIAVTLPEAMKIVFMGSEAELRVEREMHVKKQCYYIDNIDDKLVVSFSDPIQVKILSMAGETLHTFTTSSTGEPLFSRTPSVTVSTLTSAIYASDWVANCITMLDMDGNVVARYKNDDLKNPAYSATVDMGMVYVCGANSNSIHHLTPYFDKRSVVHTESEGVNGPLSISYCEDTWKLYVGIHNNDITCIKVYQLS